MLSSGAGFDTLLGFQTEFAVTGALGVPFAGSPYVLAAGAGLGVLLYILVPSGFQVGFLSFGQLPLAGCYGHRFSSVWMVCTFNKVTRFRSVRGDSAHGLIVIGCGIAPDISDRTGPQGLGPESVARHGSITVYSAPRTMSAFS